MPVTSIRPRQHGIAPDHIGSGSHKTYLVIKVQYLWDVAIMINVKDI